MKLEPSIMVYVSNAEGKHLRIIEANDPIWAENLTNYIKKRSIFINKSRCFKCETTT